MQLLTFMKTNILLLTLSLSACSLLADGSLQSTNIIPNEREQASYAMGVSIGRSLQQHGVDVDPDTLSRGLKDALSGGPTLPSAQEISQTPALADFQKTVVADQEKIHQRPAANNQTASNMFFATNRNVDGVVVLPNGLQYKIVTAGSGPIPASTNFIVTVNLQYSLLDGTVIQSSLKMGHPIRIPLNAPFVIPGLSYALTQMPVGSSWEVWIPARLAFGDLGRGQVPPSAALRFNIELISIATNSPLSRAIYCGQ